MLAFGVLLVSALLAGDPPQQSPFAAPASSAADSTIAQDATDRFAFHSAFWVNLHHFLYARARLAQGFDKGRESVAGAAQDEPGMNDVAPDQRAAWDAALAWYGKTLAPRDLLFNASMVEINLALCARENADSPRGKGIDDDLAKALERAAPLYRAVFWPAHDRGNREWLAQFAPLLAKHAAPLSEKVATLYGAPWEAGMRVDLVAYANWAGAYTTARPGHVTMSVRAPGSAGLYALEILVHESSHTMDGTLDEVLAAAAKKHAKTIPETFPHVVIFYTAGELVRELYPEHVPYAEKFGLWKRVPGWDAQRALCEKEWKPVLEGKAERDAAIERIVEQL